MDVLDIVYNILKDDPVVKEYCTADNGEFRVKYFTYPETADMSGNWVVLEPLINGKPSNLADSTWVTYDYLLHVEVWSKNRPSNRILATRIRDLLWEKLKFIQNDDIDEYDKGIYRDARRYRGTLHRNDLNELL